GPIRLTSAARVLSLVCAAPASNDHVITRCEQAMSYIEPIRPLMRRLRLNGCIVSQVGAPTCRRPSSARRSGWHRQCRRRLEQVDSTIEEAAKRGRTMTALTTIEALVLLSQRVAGFIWKNQVFGEIHFSACGGAEMGLPKSSDAASRFSSYVDGLAS